MTNFNFYYQDILAANSGARLLTIKTAAQMLGRPCQSIYNAISQNRFEIPSKKIGKFRYITVADLAQFMSNDSLDTTNISLVRQERSDVAMESASAGGAK